MAKVLAIDPGNLESGWCVVDSETARPLQKGKTENERLAKWIRCACLGMETVDGEPAPIGEIDEAVIEMVASYGMPVGATVFETCVWIGRFEQIIWSHGKPVTKLYRKEVKKNVCGSMRAKDGNVSQALIDRFAPETRNHGKGTKDQPGWFYGFRADIWQAYALAVTYCDLDMVVKW